MQTLTLDNILAQLRAALECDDLAGAAAIIEALRPPDQAELFAELDDDVQVTLLPELNPADSADILEKMDEEVAAELVAGLPTEIVIRIVDEMEPDEAADLLGDIRPEQARAVLAGLEDPDEVRPLLLHPDDSAGGLMTSEFLALRRRMTAVEAIQAIRAWKPDAETIYYLFVVDWHGRLCGVVSLRQLIVADPSTPIVEIMDVKVISVPVGADQEECARLIARYDLLALPVVDADGALLGVVTIDDVMDVLEEEATEDIQRLGGSQPLDKSYLSVSSLAMARKRIGWLLLLFVTHTLTGEVMRHFEDSLSSMLALSIFIPLLIGTAGNAGSQTTSVVIRALAVGQLKLKDFLRTIWREGTTGLIVGVSLSAITVIRALTWGMDIRLAITVAIALWVVVLSANIIGAILPFIAEWIGIDPTVASAPALDTLVDATGLFIYFTIARVILRL